MLWYVIQVKTGEETQIAEKLKDLGFQVLSPAENRPIHTGGKWTSQEYAIFPGYVFLRMEYNAENYYRVKGVPGIVRLLDGTLSYLEAEWVKLLSGREGKPLEPTLVREVDGRLEVQEGILGRFKSRIIKMDKRNRRAVIEISICGEKKDVQLGIQLAGLDSGDSEDQETGNGQVADG